MEYLQNMDSQIRLLEASMLEINHLITCYNYLDDNTNRNDQPENVSNGRHLNSFDEIANKNQNDNGNFMESNWLENVSDSILFETLHDIDDDYDEDTLWPHYLSNPPANEKLDYSHVYDRYPYRKKSDRDALMLVPEYFIEKYSNTSLPLHIPLNDVEKNLAEEILGSFVSLEDLSSISWSNLMKYFPKRLADDIRNYWTDYIQKEVSDDFICWIKNSVKVIDDNGSQNYQYGVLVNIGSHRSTLRQQSLGMTKVNFLNWIHPTLVPENKSLVDKFYRKLADFNVTSGCINTIKCFERENSTSYVVGACALREEQYNRTGELVIANINSGKIRCMDGHFTKEPNGTVLRQTVSDVLISNKLEIFFTSSYDKTIKLWSMGENTDLLGTWKGHKGQILMMTKNSRDSIIASASSDGVVNLWPILSNKQFLSEPVQLLKKSVRKDENAVVALEFSPGELLRSDILALAIGVDFTTKRGIVDIWNTTTMNKIGCIEDATGGVSCVSFNKTGTLLAVAGGHVTETIVGDGQLRLYDMRSESSRPLSNPSKVAGSLSVQTFITNHRDTDSVFFSPDPDGLLVVSCETSNGEILVFDRRFPKKFLYCLNRSDISHDGVVATSWISSGRILITGGADSQVKLWDLSIGSPNIARFGPFDRPVTSISVSPDDCSFAVGTESGSVYCYTADQGLQNFVNKEGLSIHHMNS